MHIRYSMIVEWSEEDRAYIVTLPEFGNCKTHGDSYEQAVASGREVLELLMADYCERGRPLPDPKGFVHRPLSVAAQA